MGQITQIQVRRDTEANWTAAQTAAGAAPILAAGEIGFISGSGTNAGKFKIGDGTSTWGSLTYATDGSKLTGTITASTATNVTGTVAVANGGTGSTSASAARTALGAISATDYQQTLLTPSGSIDLFPRTQVSGTRAFTSGNIYFSGFTPAATTSITKVATVVTATTATSLQYGLFTVSANTLTLVASTAVSGTPAAGIMELSFSGSQTLTAGSNYAIGFLAVGGTSATVAGVSVTQNAVIAGLGTSGIITPLLCAQSNTTYSAMPSAATVVALSSTAQASMAWARLS